MEKDNKNIHFFLCAILLFPGFGLMELKTDYRAFDRREEIDTEACSV